MVGRPGNVLISAVVGLRGLAEAGVDRYEDANPLGRFCAVPWVKSREPAQVGYTYAAAVILTGARPSDRPQVDVDDHARTVRVRWTDGATDDVQLPDPHNVEDMR